MWLLLSPEEVKKFPPRSGRISGLHVYDLPLAVVEDQAGGGEVRGETLLPALEAVQAALSRLEQRLLQTVQTLHHRRRVLVVGVLGGVHVPPEPTDERLRENDIQL